MVKPTSSGGLRRKGRNQTASNTTVNSSTNSHSHHAHEYTNAKSHGARLLMMRPIHFALMLCLALLYNEMSRNCRGSKEVTTLDQVAQSFLRLSGTSDPPQDCSSLQKRLIQKTLPTGQTIMDRTRCPDSSAWLTDYLEDAGASSTEPFLFLNFGCNKGYDSIFVAGRITRNTAVFDKQKWTDALEGAGGPGVCGQGMTSNSNAATPPDVSKPRRSVQVHCIEAMPLTVEKLRKAAQVTQANENGFYVHHYAMSGAPGGTPILFPNPAGKAGDEAFGVHVCQEDPEMKPHCVPVPTKTIDEFVQEHVQSGSNNRRIPFVSIDVEGLDFTLMKAATQTLARTDYLEFEYHDRSDWAKQKLEDAMFMLKDYGFVCYWAGRNKLWKLSGECWMPYMEHHLWSNVACVNPAFATKLAAEMEAVFEDTLVQS